MKRSLLFAAFLVAAYCPKAAVLAEKARDPDSAEQEIINLERERLSAFAKDDKPAFDRMVADDAIMTHGFGNVMTKADEIAVMRPSTPDKRCPLSPLKSRRCNFTEMPRS